MNGVVFRETVRRHVRNGVYLVILLLISIIAAAVGAFGGTSSFWMGFVTLAGVIIGCQLIGPEFSSGTLQLVLAKPVNRSTYLLSRYAGVIVAFAIFVIVPTFFEMTSRALDSKFKFRSEMFFTPLNAIVGYFMIAALLALFGSLTRSYINVALYYLLQTVLFIVTGAVSLIEQNDFPISPFFKAYPSIRTGIQVVMRNLFPNAPAGFDWRWVLMIVSNAAVTLLLACLVFRRREVPYGAD